MKINLNLKNKMQLFLITISVIIYIAAIGYISINAKKSAYKNSVDLVNAEAGKYANQIQSDLNEYMAVVRTLAKAFTVYPDMPREQWEPLFIKMYDYVYRDNRNFYKLWDSWELSRIDSTWNKPYGRVSNEFGQKNGVYYNKQERRSLEGDSELYAFIKSQAREITLPIYFDQFTDEDQEAKLMTSLISPIIVDNQYHGLVGIDLILERFQEMVNEIRFEQFPGTYAFLLSEEGKYAGHPETELLNQVAEFTLKSGEEFSITEHIEEGKNFSIVTRDQEENTHFIAFAPISIGRTNSPWFLGVSVPINSIMAQADRNFMISIMVGLIGIILLSLAIYIITKNISDPIQKITGLLKKLALGKTNIKMDLEVKSGDEIEEMADSLKRSLVSLNEKTAFANHIGQGDLDYDFKLSSEEDELGQALVNMRNSLLKAREEEKKRKAEDQKRRWVNEGLAKFADILRSNNDNLKTLGHDIIKNLVHYLDACQGGLFLLNDEDKHEMFLDMISAFAYDREKYFEKRIEYGDGIIGSCAIEKETIYMTDLPQDYIEITSGLGGSNPDSLLVVPLKIEDQVYGVIEIASFNKFESYQIEFVEKVAQNIASTIQSVKVSIQTNELLEKSQQQSEEMAAQEEEMRQNMEELQATQEEAARKGAEMESLINALENSSSIVEYNAEGYITKVNDNYLNLLNLSRAEVINTHHSGKMEFTKKQKKEYNKFWNDLKKGITKKEKSKFVVDDRELVFVEVYSPIMNEEGKVERILKISNEISEFEK
ncbi:MAG: GAF domain-containing protein [Bacteroidales bacterium]|jgi:methyl-accepting chemotaxis protein|nr:GAF domain-containing protein [Bacteroidales bacterium]